MQSNRYAHDNNRITQKFVLTEQDRHDISRIILSKTGRGYMLLTIAKMYSSRYITYKFLEQVSPSKFSGTRAEKARQRELFDSLLNKKLIEFNPENSEEFTITTLGIKYLYATNFIKFKRTPKNVD